MKKLILLLLALNILGAFIAGCSGDAATDDTATTAGADTAGDTAGDE